MIGVFTQPNHSKQDEESEFRAGYRDIYARTSEFLKHPVFNTHHTETEMLRYLRKLESRDLSLTTSMIPLGSCTMKLNATAEMFPISWPEFAKLHPFAPTSRRRGYREMCDQLEAGSRKSRASRPSPCNRTPAHRANTRASSPSANITRRAARLHRNVCLIPHLSAWNEPGERRHGRIQSRRRGLPERWRHRSRRSPREGRCAQGRPRRADGHLSFHTRRFRNDDPRDLRHRSFAQAARFTWTART